MSKILRHTAAMSKGTGSGEHCVHLFYPTKGPTLMAECFCAFKYCDFLTKTLQFVDNHSTGYGIGGGEHSVHFVPILGHFVGEIRCTECSPLPIPYPVL